MESARDEQQREGVLQMSDYLDVPRRRWAVILLCTIAGLVLAGLYYVSAPKRYSSSALVQVSALGNNANQLGGRTTGPVNMDNAAQLAQSTAVAQLIKQDLHSPLPATKLAHEITVTVPPNTTILQLTCETGTPRSAQHCAQAAASAYLSYRLSQARAPLLRVQTNDTATVSALRKSIAGLKGTLGAMSPTDPARNVPKLQLHRDQSLITVLGLQLNQAQVQLAALTADSVGTVLSPATVPTRPSSPRKSLVFPSGLVAGLVVGVVSAFALDRRGRRLHRARDVERRVGLPVVLDASGDPSAATSLVAAASPSGERFRSLAQYVTSSLDSEGGTVLVAGTSRLPGRNFMAANLAAAIARTHGDVSLVSTSGQSVGSALVPRLHLVTPDPGEYLDVPLLERAKQIVQTAQQQGKYVVVDSPTFGPGSEMIVTAELADVALVSVEAERSAENDARECVDTLERLAVPVIGAVFAALPASRLRRASSRKDITATAAKAPAGTAVRVGMPASGRGEASPSASGEPKPRAILSRRSGA